MMLCTDRDIPRLNALFGHESIWPFIKDESAPESLRYRVGELYLSTPGTLVLSPIPESAFVYKLRNGITFEVHANVLKDSREDALSAALSSVRWMFENTGCLKIVAYVATCFPNVCGFTKKCGFDEEGKMKKSVLRDGTLYDQIIYGLTKEDFDG